MNENADLLFFGTGGTGAAVQAGGTHQAVVTATDRNEIVTEVGS